MVNNDARLAIGHRRHQAQFIDAGNSTPMWGAWAVEPFAARGEVAVKVEDLVWFGRERCIVV